MMRQILRPGFWAVTLGLAGAATASASSITTYGSIVLSTLGTEGMTAPTADATLAPSPSGNGSTDSAATVGNAGPVVNNLAPLMNGSGSKSAPGGGGGSSSSARPSAPVAATGNPAVDSNLETVQVPVPAAPPATDAVVDPTTTTDSNPPTEQVPLPPVDTTTRDPNDILVGPPVQVPTGIDDSSNGDGTTNQTPEPATVTLLGLAGIGGLWRARRRK